MVRAAAPLADIEGRLQNHFSPELYFRASTRDAMTAAIRAIEGEAAAAEAAKLGKPALVERASVLATDRKWLPKILAEAATLPPLTAHGEEREARLEPRTMDTRTTAEAMLDAIEADDEY